MKKQTIGIISVISVSLLLFFQNCGKFETVSLEDELKLSSVNTFSDTAKKLLGLTCTANTVVACEINGQQGYKYCEGGKFSECRGQSIIDGNINDNLGMQPPIKYTCQGDWTMPGTTCRNKADEYGNFVVGTTTQLYDRNGTNCGYSCECVETDPANRTQVSWACTKDGNITIPGVKGIIGYVPSKLLNEEPIFAVTEKRPSPTNSSLEVLVSNRQHNSLNPLRYVDVFKDGFNTNARLLFAPIPVDCFTEIGKCTITDQFTLNGKKYVFVNYKSNPAEMISEFQRAMKLIIPDFEINFVIKNAFTTQAMDSQIRVRMSRLSRGSFSFSPQQAIIFDKSNNISEKSVPDNDSYFHFFKELGFTNHARLQTRGSSDFVSESDFKMQLDKTNAFLYPKNDKDLEQNYYLSKAIKLYSLSSVTNSLLFKFEGNLISTTLIASRQDESFNIDEKATTIDVSKTNTTCSLERNISSDINNPKFVKYMNNIIPACSDWYMFLYGDGKATTISAATKALENFNAYTFRVGYKVNDFYLNPNVTRKYWAISTYLMLVEQRTDIAWPSLNVPKLGGGNNMTENNMILRESLGIHPVEMFYKTYGYSTTNPEISDINNKIHGDNLEWWVYGDTCLEWYSNFNPSWHLREIETACAYRTFKAARVLKYPGVKWSELVYNDDQPVVTISPDSELASLGISAGVKNDMISQGVGIYIIRLPLVKKILVTSKGVNNDKNSIYARIKKFSINFHDQGIINTLQSPDFQTIKQKIESKLTYINDFNQRKNEINERMKKMYFSPNYTLITSYTLDDNGNYVPNYAGGLYRSFFQDRDLNFDTQNYSNDEHLDNYATHSVSCTVNNGVFCPTYGGVWLNEVLFDSNNKSIDINYLFNNGTSVHNSVSMDLSKIKNNYLGQDKYEQDNKMFLCTEDKTKCYLSGEKYSTHYDYTTDTYAKANRITWQYELDISTKSAHKITMYYRGFEPRPPENTMTPDPIPFTVIVDPGYSIIPK